MKNVTISEYKELVSKYWNGEITSEELDQYEIVLEKLPTHSSDFVNNLIIKLCDDLREESNRVLYTGSIGQSKLINFRELFENGFTYVSNWSDAYNEVFISDVHNVIITTCEGDLFISLPYSSEAYENELEHTKKFYEEN